MPVRSSQKSRKLLIVCLFGILLFLVIAPAVILLRFYLFLTKYRRLSRYIIAQSKLETDQFKSPVFKKYHNLFGMKNAEHRPQLGHSLPDTEYRIYPFKFFSIIDFVQYLNSVNFPVTVTNGAEYVGIMKANGYFTSDQIAYQNRLNELIT